MLEIYKMVIGDVTLFSCLLFLQFFTCVQYIASWRASLAHHWKPLELESAASSLTPQYATLLRQNWIMIKVDQHVQMPTTPSFRPSVRYPSLILTLSTIAGRRPSSSAVTPGPQSQCLPSILSYTFATSSPAAATIRRLSNIILVMGLSYAYAS